MMIMRPPQQGQACSALCGSSGLALAALWHRWDEWHCEQLAGMRDVVGSGGAGEQAVVADAVEALWQHVHQEPADELVGSERHRLVSLGTLEPVVLPPEGDAVVIACDQAAVGDGDAVGVARQIAQHLLGPAERSFAVDHPFRLRSGARYAAKALAFVSAA